MIQVSPPISADRLRFVRRCNAVNRYFIHIENGTGALSDDLGGTWESDVVAIGEAAKMAGELLREDTRDALEDYRLVLRVEREGGVPVGQITVTLSLATQT